MRRRRWPLIVLPLAILILLLIIFWNWDWFIPLVDSRASAALGRKVTIQHLHVRLGGTVTAAADNVTIANPDGFPARQDPLAHIDRLLVKVDLVKYIFHGTMALPLIEIDHPVANVRELPNGKNNYTLSLAPAKGRGKPPQLGQLIITQGVGQVVIPSYKTDFTLQVATKPPPKDDKLFTGGEIVVDAKGRYADAPISGQLIGGALLQLRNPSLPYPVDLHIENGTTKAHLVGTLTDPRHFGGAKLKLSFSGQNMANLFPLTGVPIPQTPPFSVAGDFDYAHGAFQFKHFAGKLGSSDLEGTITEAPGSPRRKVTADLSSDRVDLTDLAGFLGGTPGKTSTPGQDAATKAKVEQANASPNLLPEQKFDLPKIKIADVDLHYHGKHIINKGLPLDDLTVHLTIVDGHITVDPLNFGVGSGTIASSIDLHEVDGVLHTKANIDFRKLPLAKLMKSTSGFAGNGTVGGSAYIAGTGNSVANTLGHGDGHAALFLEHGGRVSALLVDLAGLQVGDAMLSALGVPDKTPINCLVSDFALKDGVVDTKAFLIATPAANILGSGTANLQTEKLDLRLWTEATHVSIGSLSTPIDIGGTLKHPGVLPAPGPLALRAGSAVGLGLLFPPLALLPTIRLGLGDKNACADTLQALHEGKKPPQ